MQPNYKAIGEIYVWPFSRKKKSTPVPAIRCNGIDVTWNPTVHWWEFTDGGIAYSQCDNPVFDPSVLTRLPDIVHWLEKLDVEINEEIKKYLEGWCDEWRKQKDLVGIDVSWLATKNEVDVSYAHEDWADLGINIIITDGRITDSYAGD